MSASDGIPDVAELLGFDRPQAPAVIVPPEPARVLPKLDAIRVTGELCRRSLKKFVQTFWSELEPNGRPFVDNAGTDAILQHLQAVGDGHIKKLGMAVSPGFGKTTLTSVALPAWIWTRDAARRFICASHTHDLAAGVIAPKFLRLVQSDKYLRLFPYPQLTFTEEVIGVELESDAAKAIKNSCSGARFALGVGGALTGIRGDCGIIDDSLNAIHAGNPEKVTAVNDWYDQAFDSRLDAGPNHAIIVIQQRLAERDLIHRMRELGAEILELPARFEEGRRARTSIWVDNRQIEGEILAPEIHSEEFLAEKLRTMRPHGFATQFQQRPTVRGGEIFKVDYWRYHIILPPDEPIPPAAQRPDGAWKGAPIALRRKPDGRLDVDWVCLSVDPTGGSESETASGLGMGIIIGKGQRRSILEDLTPGPRTWGQTKHDLRRALIRTSDLTGWATRIHVLVEQKALGASAISEITEWLAAGIKNARGQTIKAKVEAYEPSGKGNKEARADFLEPDYFEVGLLTVADGADWINSPRPGNDFTIIEEFAAFPRGTRDDRIDYVAQCLDHYRPDAEANPAGKWQAAYDALFNRPVPEPASERAEPAGCQHYWVEGKCTRCGVPA